MNIMSTRQSLILSLLCCIAALLANKFGNAHATILLIFASAALSTRACSFSNPIQMMWMSAHYTFCLMPSAILYISSAGYQFSAAIYLSVFTAIFLSMTKSFNGNFIILPKLLTDKLYLLFILVATSLLYMTNGESFLYTTPLLGVIFVAHCQSSSRSAAAFSYGIFAGYVFIYAIFFWSEFGRLVIAGSLLAPLIAVLGRYNLRIAKLPLLILTATGGLFGSLLRIEGATPSTIVTAALRDSAISPLLTAQDLLNRVDPNSPLRWNEWWDQFILYFLGPFPRQFWPGKPYGFGFQYVIDNFESSYVTAGHSIAATFMGEHIYYLSFPILFAGSMLSIILVIVTARTAQSLKIFLGSGAYLVAMFIPTFYWGGMASFSQRFLFGFVSALGVMLAIYTFSFVSGKLLNRRLAVSRFRNSR